MQTDKQTSKKNIYQEDRQTDMKQVVKQTSNKLIDRQTARQIYNK